MKLLRALARRFRRRPKPTLVDLLDGWTDTMRTGCVWDAWEEEARVAALLRPSPVGFVVSLPAIVPPGPLPAYAYLVPEPAR